MNHFDKTLFQWPAAKGLIPFGCCMVRIIACLCCLPLAGCVGTSVTRSITTVDGATVDWQFTDGRPNGASNEAAEVVLSGCLICPGEGRDKRAHLSLTYGVMPKSGSIRNVNVFNAAGPVTLHPSKTIFTPKGSWGSWSRPVPATPGNVPWLYAEGETILVHKFVVQFTDGRKTTLQQPTFMSASDKRAFLNEIVRINLTAAM